MAIHAVQQHVVACIYDDGMMELMCGSTLKPQAGGGQNPRRGGRNQQSQARQGIPGKLELAKVFTNASDCGPADSKPCALILK